MVSRGEFQNDYDLAYVAPFDDKLVELLTILMGAGDAAAEKLGDKGEELVLAIPDDVGDWLHLQDDPEEPAPYELRYVAEAEEVGYCLTQVAPIRESGGLDNVGLGVECTIRYRPSDRQFLFRYMDEGLDAYMREVALPASVLLEEGRAEPTALARLVSPREMLGLARQEVQ